MTDKPEIDPEGVLSPAMRRLFEDLRERGMYPREDYENPAIRAATEKFIESMTSIDEDIEETTKEFDRNTKIMKRVAWATVIIGLICILIGTIWG